MTISENTNSPDGKEGAAIELSDVRSPNTVYHVRVEAHSKRYGRLIEKFNRYSNIFFTHRKAYEVGMKYLNEMLQQLCDARGSCKGQERGPTYEGFVEKGQVRYKFTIMEIDLQAAKSYDWAARPRSGFRLANRPPYVEYSYNSDGDMLDCNYIYYLDGLSEFGSACELSRIKYRPGDERPEAGTKFKPGDPVRLAKPYFSNGYQTLFDTEQVFVVADRPPRDSDGFLKENTYGIETVSKDGEFLDFAYDHPFQRIHESELQPYDAELPENSPLRFLQQLARGEFGNSNEQADIAGKLERGEISLLDAVSWRDIPELKAAVSTEEKNEK